MPIPTAVATEPPLSITGCQAFPTCSNSIPRIAIAPTNNIAAAATSAIIPIPIPRFFASDFNLGDIPLTPLSNCPVTSVTFCMFFIVFVVSLTPFILENTPKAVASPPSISTIPIIKDTLSTPLQSPFFIASQFLPNSSTTFVNP